MSNLNTPYALAPATIGNRFELLLGLGAGGEVLAPYGGTPPLQLAGVPLAGNNLAYTDVDGAGRRLLLSWDILTVAGAWIFDDGGLADAGTTQPFNGANQIGAVVPGPFGDDGGTLIFVGELGASEWRFLDPAQGLAQRGIVTLANSADGIFAAAGDPAHRQLVVMGGDANGNPQLIAVVVDPTPHDVLLAGYGAINNADYPQLQLVDVNGDGVGDLVAAFPQEGEVDIRDGYPDGGFDQSAVSIVAPNALNGAGLAFVPLFGTPAFPDLVYAPLSGADSNLYLFPNGGDGRFLAGDGGQLCVTPVPAGSLVGLAAGDAGFFVLDGDSLAAYHP